MLGQGHLPQEVTQNQSRGFQSLWLESESGSAPEPRAEPGYTRLCALKVPGYLALTWHLIKVLIS